MREIDFFKNDDYIYISNYIESKISELRGIDKFNINYLKNIELIEEIENNLLEKQRNKFEELIKTFYELEEYYFAFAYLLGIKSARDIENL